MGRRWLLVLIWVQLLATGAAADGGRLLLREARGERVVNLLAAPTPLRAGVASFDFMKENRLWEAARQQGWRLRQNLKETQSRVKSIGDVRGRGVMIGVEFVDPRGHTDSSTPPPEFGDLAADVQKECFKRGLIIERGGRQGCVLRFLPPAVITDAQVDASCQIFSDAVSFVEEQHGL